ncbi:hypothetical protein ASC87_10835 [Rhizobacter sp. Root1221]|nr:hypothetical protein ASC87_10835 [Rhizobacter sp. Root1221]
MKHAARMPSTTQRRESVGRNPNSRRLREGKTCQQFGHRTAGPLSENALYPKRTPPERSAFRAEKSEKHLGQISGTDMVLLCLT